MIWEIFSIGDARYLTTILNAVAVMTGGSDFKTIASIGFILGIILTGFQGIIGGGREFKLQSFVISLVIYSVMFGPRVTVTVTDVYTDEVYQVDNTPFGLAAFGAITSGVTTVITRQIEQTFTLPTMLEGGFVGSLRTLLGGRSMRELNHKAASYDTPPGNPYRDNLETALANYVRDCTQVAIKRGEIDEKAILAAPDMWAAMLFTSDVYGTVLPLYPPKRDNIGPEGYEQNCSEAHVDITNRMAEPTFLEAFERQAATIFGKDPELKVQNALSVFGQGTFTSITGNAQGFMMNNVMHYLYERGWRESLLAEGRAEEAVMLSSAAAQRDIQWAGEASMFVQMSRPMTAFFEGLVYSLAPFMAFLIGFGSMGISLVGKYMMLGLWVQIMPPIMALINLYFNYAAQDGLRALVDSGTELTSVYGMMAMYPELNHWVGMSGLLGASVPGIAMMLLYGSSVAATSMANRLQGGDHIDEKIAAPDVMRPAPVVSGMSSATSDVFKGTQTSIASELVSGAGVSELQKFSTAQSRGVSESATESLGKSVLGHAAADFSSKEGVERLREIGASINASQGSQFTSVKQSAARLVTEHGTEKTDRDVLTGAVAVSGGVDGQLKGGLGDGAPLSAALALSGGVKGSTQSQRQLSGGEMLKLVNSHGEDVSKDSKLSAEVGSQVMSKSADRLRQTFDKTLSQGASKNFSEQLQSAVTAQRAYQHSESVEKSWGLSQNVSGVVLAAEVGKSDEAMRAMQMILNNPDPMLTDHTLRAAYDNQYKNIKPHFDDPRTATAGAFFNALRDVSGVGSDAQLSNRAAVLSHVMGAARFARPQDTTLDNSELMREPPSAPGISADVRREIDGYRNMLGGVDQTAEGAKAGIGQMKGRVAGGTSDASGLVGTNADAFYDAAVNKAQADHSGNLWAQNADAFVGRRDEYMSGAALNRPPTTALFVEQQMNNASEVLGSQSPDWVAQGFQGEPPSKGEYTDDIRKIERNMQSHADNTLNLGPFSKAYSLGSARSIEDAVSNGFVAKVFFNGDEYQTFDDSDVAVAKAQAINAVSDDGKGHFADENTERWAHRAWDDTYNAASSGERATQTLTDIENTISLRMGSLPSRAEEEQERPPVTYQPNMNAAIPIR